MNHVCKYTASLLSVIKHHHGSTCRSFVVLLKTSSLVSAQLLYVLPYLGVFHAQTRNLHQTRHRQQTGNHQTQTDDQFFDRRPRRYRHIPTLSISGLERSRTAVVAVADVIDAVADVIDHVLAIVLVRHDGTSDVTASATGRRVMSAG